MAEVDKMIQGTKPFLLLVESDSWPLLEGRGLKVLIEIPPPYRSKDRSVRLLTNIGRGEEKEVFYEGVR